MDLLAQALSDFYLNNNPEKLFVENKFSDPDEYPLEVFFRKEDDLSELDDIALSYARGRVLDIGAGAGCISLILQEKGFDVTALENSKMMVELMNLQGVSKIAEADIYQYEPVEKYDTVYLLMNGIGLSGTVQGLESLLEKLKKIINPDGQIIFDSSDVEYFYQGDIPKPFNYYYGEIEYRFRYKQQYSNWFSWLYLDFKNLVHLVHRLGWIIDLLYDDGSDQYLVRLTLNK